MKPKWQLSEYHDNIWIKNACIFWFANKIQLQIYNLPQSYYKELFINKRPTQLHAFQINAP